LADLAQDTLSRNGGPIATLSHARFWRKVTDWAILRFPILDKSDIH
jgi:hypothetical protein